jgi:RNA polymerase sigma-70 factor, ECF subfamily
MASSPQTSRARLVALPSPTLAQADDATLARAAGSGDPRAISVLWDRFSPLVRRMLRRTLGPHAVVDDLLQQVFLRVLGQLGAASSIDTTQLRPLVVAVTARLLSAELRRHRVQRLLRLRSHRQRADALHPVGNTTTKTALSSLYRILDELDADARLAFTLKHFEGLQLTELAAAMDASLSSAKRRLARANAHVQAAVRDDAALSAYTTAVSLGDAP